MKVGMLTRYERCRDEQGSGRGSSGKQGVSPIGLVTVFRVTKRK